MRTLIVASLAMVLLASRADAQGALSTQGLGYPTGQMSARAEGTGGAVADFDRAQPRIARFDSRRGGIGSLFPVFA